MATKDDAVRYAVRCDCDPGPDGYPHRYYCAVNISAEPYRCRYCGNRTLTAQEIDWRMCEACYADGIAEQESNR